MEDAMRRFGLLASIAVLLCAAPLAANAQRAWAINGADIFAGPGSDYPVVARLAPGVQLRINGCLGDYQWCDVSFGPNRGWAYAGDLGYAYQSSRVPVIEYGPRLALPVITFSLGNYWDRYYRARPFYHERHEWERHWNEHRNDYRGNNNWHGNEYRGNNNWHGNDYRGNNNWQGQERRQEYRQNDEHRGRNDARVTSPSVTNDGHGGYAPARPGPNGTTAPTTPTPSTPGYYTGQQ
jgi:uncharacterized protein YraI